MRPIPLVLAWAATFGGGVLVGVYIGFWLMTRPEQVVPPPPVRGPRDYDEPDFA